MERFAPWITARTPVGASPAEAGEIRTDGQPYVQKTSAFSGAGAIATWFVSTPPAQDTSCTTWSPARLKAGLFESREITYLPAPSPSIAPNASVAESEETAGSAQPVFGTVKRNAVSAFWRLAAASDPLRNAAVSAIRGAAPETRIVWFVVCAQL